MKPTDTTTDPDMKQTSGPMSRRKFLAATSAGLASTIAGCSDFTGTGPGGNGESPPPAGNDDNQAGETKYPGPVSEFVIGDIGLSDTSFDLVLSEERNQSPVKGELVVYSSPTRDHSQKTKIGRTEIEQSSVTKTHTVSIDIPKGYGQQLHYSLALKAPTATTEETVYTTGNALIPFHNAVEGKDMLRVSSPRADASKWRDGLDTINKVEVWLNEPDEPVFDVPAVYREFWDEDWYEYRTVEFTALVRFAVFDDYELEGQYNQPYFEWVPVNFQLGEWEMLEAFRWNSIATQMLESGQLDYGDGRGKANTPYMKGGIMGTGVRHEDASKAGDPFEQYYKSRNELTNARDGRESFVNPMWFAASRPISKRIADELDANLDNPSFNTLEESEYYKATALKTLVGGGAPWGFSIGSYTKTPEEALNNWFEWAANDGEVEMACVGATALFAGIGSHLLDHPIAYVHNDNPAGGHALAGVLGLEPPSNRPREHQFADTHQQRTIDTPRGEMLLAECTRGASSIGWGPEGSVTYYSYIQGPQLETHIPRNDDLEPAKDGEMISDASEEKRVNMLVEAESQFHGMPDAEDF